MRTLLLFFILFQISCSSKSFLKNSLDVLPEKLQKIEGEFSNLETKMDGSIHSSYLIEPPFPEYNPRQLNSSLKKSKIRIKFTSPRRLTIELIESNKVTFSKEFKYIIHEKYLYIKKNKWHSGVPLLLYKQQHEKLYLWLDNQNNLIVLADGSMSGGFFILGFGTPIKRKLQFQRLQ